MSTSATNFGPVKITETVLRDAHQSLLATRMRTEQMLPMLSTNITQILWTRNWQDNALDDTVD